MVPTVRVRQNLEQGDAGAQTTLSTSRPVSPVSDASADAAALLSAATAPQATPQPDALGSALSPGRTPTPDALETALEADPKTGSAPAQHARVRPLCGGSGFANFHQRGVSKSSRLEVASVVGLGSRIRRWMTRSDNLTQEGRSKGGRSRAAQKTAAAQVSKLTKVREALESLKSIADEVTDDDLKLALRGLLVETLYQGDRWQRLRAAEMIRTWYLDADEDQSGKFKELLDAFTHRRAEEADR